MSTIRRFIIILYCIIHFHFIFINKVHQNCWLALLVISMCLLINVFSQSFYMWMFVFIELNI